MSQIIFIFLGAGIGGVFRYWISESMHAWMGKAFPYGTLIVNVTGCLLMGLLFVLILERLQNFTPHLRSLLLIGLLGGYTTFSAFSMETLALIENGAWIHALLNVMLNTILGLLAVWVGVFSARTLF